MEKQAGLERRVSGMKRQRPEEREEEEDDRRSSGEKRRRLLGGANSFLIGSSSFARRRTEVWVERILRPMIRDAISNAFDRRFPTNLWMPMKQLQQSVSSETYRLRFGGKLGSNFFTGNVIKDENGNQLRIDIIDVSSNKIIVSGPWSSIKVQVLVIDSDFGSDGRKEWTREDFEKSILNPRDGKGQLLTGGVIVALYNGSGFVSEAKITDNSSCCRTKKFKLGARVVLRSAPEGRVQEAISDPFRVREGRGETYQKHSRPSLDDEVWRLKCISKGGENYKKLEQEGILSVRHFLMALNMVEDWLHKMLGKKIWETTTKHARECISDGRRYRCDIDEDGDHRIALFFDSTFRLDCILDQNGDDVTQKVADYKTKELKKKAYDKMATAIGRGSLENFAVAPGMPIPNNCSIIQAVEQHVQATRTEAAGGKESQPSKLSCRKKFLMVLKFVVTLLPKSNNTVVDAIPDADSADLPAGEDSFNWQSYDPFVDVFDYCLTCDPLYECVGAPDVMAFSEEAPPSPPPGGLWVSNGLWS